MAADRMAAPISHPAHEPITAISLDGNSIAAATVSIDQDGLPFVRHLRTIELDCPIEKVSRHAHPIFMDVDYLEFPNEGLLNQALSELLADPAFQHPIAGVLPAQSIRDWREEGSRQPEHAAERLSRGIGSFHTANPFSYPQLVSYAHLDTSPTTAETWVWKAALNDVLAIGFNLSLQPRTPGSGGKLPFYGIVTGKRALSEILNLALACDQAPTTIIDVGKLRTVYVGGMNQRVHFTHAIPVGMLRDDNHYFKSLPPRVDRLLSPVDEPGGLFFPPDATPSPLFESSASSPQIDCTRFSTQIARYAYRVVHDLWSGVTNDTVQYYLTGRPSRLPGMREFLQFKAGLQLERLAENGLCGLKIAPELTWCDVADHLVPIGAAIAFHRRKQSRFGLVLRDQRPIPMAPQESDVAGLEAGRIYLIENPKLARRARISSR